MADKKKASPDSVKAVQKFLKEQGFYKGDISGIKTWGTEAAIRAYQVQNKLKNTGEIDDVPTVAMSKSTPAPQAGGSAQPQAAAPATAPQANPNEGIIAPTPSMADKKKPSDYKGLSKEEAIRQFKKEANAYKRSFNDTPEHIRMIAAQDKLTQKGIDYNDYILIGRKHQEALTSRDPDIAEMAKASAA